jgi:hypothetical protein
VKQPIGFVARVVTVMYAAVFVTACVANTHIDVMKPQAVVHVKEVTYNTSPIAVTMRDTSFGNYELKIESPGAEPFYGLLPLKLAGGNIAADILLFAPALFFNTRRVFHEYELDPDHGVVRYRDKPTDPWVTHAPSEEEKARARQHFGVAGVNKP